MVARIAASLVAIKAPGLSILLVEHHARVALEIADRAYLIERGVIQYRGLSSELRANQAVQRQYLTV